MIPGIPEIPIFVSNCGLLIDGKGKFDRNLGVINKLNWLDIRGLMKLKIVTIGFSAYKGQLGEDLKRLFTTPNHKHKTRYHERVPFIQHHTRTKTYLHSFSSLGPRLLNDVLPLVHATEDSKVLRKEVKDLYLNEQKGLRN